ncbi:MAG TPA: NAD(P)/FAD-dependent oxidoreductase [Thermoanaerobaculia bacterium]|nr:NAD(P)/FAD-dependent oxidoreductase [Thermoanaerobaculia bacterium]
MSSLPTSTPVLIIGGGPAGSTAASLLARDGIEVMLLEREVFPRYHIGESLLPSCLEIVDLIGARALIEAEGFQRKPGAYLEWGAERWSLDFGELRGRHTYSFQVERSRFDHLLLQHAAAQGAAVHQGIEVGKIEFDGTGRPRRARWARRGGDRASGEIAFDYLVDASGRHGIMASRYLRNRRYHQVFQNVAVWGYWEGAACDAPGYRQGAIAVASIPEGWLWSIPFSDGRTSIGVVLHKSAFQAQNKTSSREQIYRSAIASCPLMTKVCAAASLVSDVMLESDYSYAAEVFCGAGFFLCGDAACFLDPLLSTGVHLAMLSALLCAAATASLLRGEVAEETALAFFEKSYRQAYLRFLVFVSAFYDQRRGKDAYFAEAQRLSRYDLEGRGLRQAFLNLVSGLEDLSAAEAVAEHLMGEMSRQLAENLTIRQDKEGLARAGAELKDRLEKSAQFFDRVEGLGSISPETAVDGLYVVVQPRLGLAGTPAGPLPASPG